MKHLWEVEHSYYCSESFQGHHDYESFNDFLEDWKDADLAYNLLFRWDWHIPEYEEDYDEEDIERLELYIMLQRKGLFVSCYIKIDKSDEAKVKRFLAPRMKYLVELWRPLKL